MPNQSKWKMKGLIQFIYLSIGGRLTRAKISCASRKSWFRQLAKSGLLFLMKLIVISSVWGSFDIYNTDAFSEVQPTEKKNIQPSLLEQWKDNRIITALGRFCGCSTGCGGPLFWNDEVKQPLYPPTEKFWLTDTTIRVCGVKYAVQLEPVVNWNLHSLF